MASYPFRDTTAQAAPEGGYPAEALRLGGTWLEDIVPGYRTLWVRGRELLAPELETETVGTRDGVLLRSRRYPERTITVGYQIIAADAAAFRAAYNKLAAALDVQQAECVFSDEPNKYFTGTPSGTGQVEDGRCAVTGEFSILCADPCKYSLTEYAAAPDSSGTFSVDYHGTHPAAPVLEASFPGTEDSDGDVTGADCGFVAFLSQDGRVIQLGDPDEMDTEEYPESQTLVNKRFKTWGTTTQAEWPVNAGRTSSDATTQAGSAGILTDEDGCKMAGALDYGSGANYHGPSITRKLPADASGHVGARFFRLTYDQRLCMGARSGAASERGCFQALCVTVDGSTRTVLAGVSIFKPHAGNQATINLYVRGNCVDAIHVDITHGNKFFGWASNAIRSTTISKQGRYVSYNVAGLKRKFFDESINFMEMHELTFVFGRYASQPALSVNGLYSAKLIADHCDTWRDIPNKFSAGDVVRADCAAGEITLNNSSTPELGALGNDWETFRLYPGENQIGTAWSDWAQAAPQLRLRYREVWL